MANVKSLQSQYFGALAIFTQGSQGKGSDATQADDNRIVQNVGGGAGGGKFRRVSRHLSRRSNRMENLPIPMGLTIVGFEAAIWIQEENSNDLSSVVVASINILSMVIVRTRRVLLENRYE